MTVEQIALGAAAAGLLFWPQLSAMLKVAAAKGVASGPLAVGGFDRTAAVADLLKLQGQMHEAGLNAAADLTGRLLVELVTNGRGPTAPPPPPAPGGKK